MTCNPTAAMKNTSLKSADSAIRPLIVCAVWYVTAMGPVRKVLRFRIRQGAFSGGTCGGASSSQSLAARR
jgi:hypothetical protein